MKSTSGRETASSNPRALADSDSRYWREPSACRVSKASDDLPEPLTPVMTVNWWRGMASSTSFRLWVRAPLMWMGVLRVGDNARLGLGEKREDACGRPLITCPFSPFPVLAGLSFYGDASFVAVLVRMGSGRPAGGPGRAPRAFPRRQHHLRRALGRPRRVRHPRAAWLGPHPDRQSGCTQRNRFGSVGAWPCRR